MRAWFVMAVILAALAASCTRSNTGTASPSAPTSTGSDSPAQGKTPSAEPVTDYASFTRALAAAGSTVHPGEQTTSEPFTAPARTSLIDGVKVTTYEYPNEHALDEVRSQISRDGYSVPTRTGGVAIVEWVATPHFYSGGALLVVYVGDNRHVIEALDQALGPQFAGG